MCLRFENKKYSRRDFLRTAAGAGAAALSLSTVIAAIEKQPAKNSKPNIILILGDDIGYGDFGCYGATKVKTPNIDRLALEGIRFTDAHSSSAVCTPTRFSILTGEYAWRKQAGAGILSGQSPLCLPPDKSCLPAFLKRNGYVTGCVGKWHLGLGNEEKTDYNRQINPGPLEVGFDYAFIIPATGDRVPCVFVENHSVVGFDPEDPITLDYSVKRGEPRSFVNGIPRIGAMAGGEAARWKDQEITDTLNSKATKFIEQHKDEPFFLYFPTHEIHVPRVPNKRFAGSSQAGVRGDVIQEFDASVAAVMETLERLKLTDNTLVIVTSDNGGTLDTNGPDTVHSGTKETNKGHAFNGPLRAGKSTVYEGGHRVPFIARWPGKIKPDTQSKQLICTVDMFSTFTAVAEKDLPSDAALDSYNILPALMDDPKPVRDHLILHDGRGINGRLAIREGQWKLIEKHELIKKNADKAKPDINEVELYNLDDDLSEQNNLAGKEPKIVKRLTELLEKYKTASRSREL